MTFVVSFEDYTPPPRYDSIPWSSVQIQEATTSTGTWTTLETQALSPVDADPSQPSSRDFTTSLATALELWYRLIFLDGSTNEAQPTLPVQNVPGRPSYASTDELAALIGVNAVTNHASLRRVLEAAALEIDTELGLDEPYGSPPALVVEVNIERAVEHWRQMKAPFGIIGLGPELGSSFTAKDSWERHALKLAALKEVWGIA